VWCFLTYNEYCGLMKIDFTGNKMCDWFNKDRDALSVSSELYTKGKNRIETEGAELAVRPDFFRCTTVCTEGRLFCETSCGVATGPLS
jgi:hypothetical protein